MVGRKCRVGSRELVVSNIERGEIGERFDVIPGSAVLYRCAAGPMNFPRPITQRDAALS